MDGCVVFIPGVLPDEVVQARITRRRKSFAEAELLKIIRPSDRRIDPVCPLAGQCPACCYQHIAYTEELRLKQSQFINILKRIGHVDTPVCLETVPSPVATGYRNKIVLHAAPSSSSGPTEAKSSKEKILGYYAADNSTIMNVSSCPLAIADLNSLLVSLRADSAFMSTLKYKQRVTLRHTEKDGAIHWTRELKPDRTILTERTIIGDISVPYNSFFQVNRAMADAATSRTMDLLKEDTPSSLVDLYSGSGVFALAAGKAGVPAVLGIDSDRAAIRAAKRNAANLDLPGVEFIAMPADEALEPALKAVDPGKTTLILDPPRIGLDKSITGISMDNAVLIGNQGLFGRVARAEQDGGNDHPGPVYLLADARQVKLAPAEDLDGPEALLPGLFKRIDVLS